MPQVTVYIREEDIEKWKAIQKKSEWLHNALAGESEELSPNYGLKPPPLARKPYPDLELPFVPKPPDPETGYPCCTKEKRCKHWEYDGLTAQWVNSLTGKTREVV